MPGAAGFNYRTLNNSMSRPQPKILLRTAVGLTNLEMIVTQGSGWWMVLLDGTTPFNAHRKNMYIDDRPKYIKNGSPNEHQARQLADRLNRIFKTDRFQVVKVA